MLKIQLVLNQLLVIVLILFSYKLVVPFIPALLTAVILAIIFNPLFTRILRDYHLNCYNYDAYSKSIYAKNFTKPNFKKADMVTSFEAVEHFSNPQKEFNKMFKFKPHFALITTKLFSGQKKNWDYFEYETGQHIFFYTKKALRIIAKKFNYNIVYLEYGYILFYSKKYKLSNISIFMLKNILIKRKFFPFIKIFAMFFNSNGYEKDYIKSKYN